MIRPAKRRVQVAVTDDKGQAVFSNLPEGEYILEISKEGYFPGKKRVIVTSGRTKAQVNLRQINKSTLKQENERLRALITASTDLAQMRSCVSESHRLIDMSPLNFRKDALKQFRKTAKVAHNRIEELRLRKRSLGVSVSPRDLRASFQSSSSKKPLIK